MMQMTTEGAGLIRLLFFGVLAFLGVVGLVGVVAGAAQLAVLGSR